MENKKKKTDWQQGLMIVGFMLVGAICGILMVRFVDAHSLPGTPMWKEFSFLAIMLVLLYVAFFLQVLVHEAGHLVFGLRSGYQLSSFRIGSLMWLIEDGKIVLRKMKIAGTGGQCLMIPPDMVDGKIPVVLYNLGGAIMNLLVSGLFLLVYLLIPKGSLLALFAMMMIAVGVILALTNGIPLRMGMLDNDGCNARSLGKSRDAMRAFWIQMKINEQVAKGVRLKDMPSGWFIVPSDTGIQNSMVASLGVFACNRLMDEKNFEEADRLMERLLSIDSGMVGIHQKLLICDQMCCEMLRENRPKRLSHLCNREQKKFMRSMKNFPSVIRTEYMYALLVEHDEEKAGIRKKHFEKVGKTYPYPGDIQSDRELMELAAECAVSRTSKTL